MRGRTTIYTKKDTKTLTCGLGYLFGVIRILFKYLMLISNHVKYLFEALFNIDGLIQNFKGMKIISNL